ncbi:SigE family RNA polymerase sigma factor [Streptomyces sp. NBC_01478]|uniref:SigE family RNA polymerase sigma factor n=1 Tax=Streptomyces sp. NBC_01478 TaxID=2903882 RepID=UPI002E36F059|nr:SigE family RNA polymerase sigma factor [Streptomyces sp. NBC_01478]
MSTATTTPAAPARQAYGGPAVAHSPLRARADALRRAVWRLVREAVSGGRSPALPDSPAGHADLGEPGIDELYSHRRLDLVRLALLLVDDLPTAEDVVQDVFAALCRRHGERLTGLDNPDAYLRTSVVNTSRSVLRRRRTVRAHVPERAGHAPSAEEPVLLREEHGEVIAALHRLTRRQREVLVLRYWSHLSEAQIADTLGLSRGAVKSTASRALVALRRELEAPR